MALSVKIKTNSKHIEKRFQRLKSKFPSIIDKGILQAGFQLLDIIRTKTAKGIWLFARKDRKIEVTQRGIVQEGYSEDDLPWDMVNYKRVFKPNVDIEKFM